MIVSNTPTGSENRADHREELHVAEAHTRETTPSSRGSPDVGSASPSPGQCSNSRPSATQTGARGRSPPPRSRPPPTAAPASGSGGTTRHRKRRPRPDTAADGTRTQSHRPAPRSEISSGMMLMIEVDRRPRRSARRRRASTGPGSSRRDAVAPRAIAAKTHATSTISTAG